MFEVTLLQCIYERVGCTSWDHADRQKYSRSHDLASEDDLEALKYFEEPKAPSAPSSPQRSIKAAPASVTPVAAAAVLPEEEVHPEAAAAEAAEAEAEAEDPFEGIPILHRANAELYLFDLDADVFVIQEKDVSVDMASNGEYDSEFDPVTPN